MREKIGVYVCHCGTNIAGTVDVEDVSEWAEKNLAHRGVVIGRNYKFMCSSLGQELIEKDINELGLTRVVVAACSPHLHEQTFRTACDRAGLNPYLCELVSIREQVSWVHTDKSAATEKSKAVLSGGVLSTVMMRLRMSSVAGIFASSVFHSGCLTTCGCCGALRQDTVEACPVCGHQDRKS